MIPYDQIREVHLEMSTLCNAICPECPRNFHGYPHNSGYPEVNFTLADAQAVFTPEFLQQLNLIMVNGNFGDFVMNPESVEILQYFSSHNANLCIQISTNGGARNRDFWQKLSSIPHTTVMFCIDGLSDTHHLYRQNTRWETVIKNARAFIESGGSAIWKMIRFKHNEHQIDECFQMSKELGFLDFHIIDHGRNTGPVFDKNGKLTHVLGDFTYKIDFHDFFRDKNHSNETVIFEEPVSDYLTCESETRKQIYIAATGDVFPCCYLGFYPKTYGKTNWMAQQNSLLAKMSNDNNAVKHGIKNAIQWFDQVRNSWQKRSAAEGRINLCDRACGNKRFKQDTSLYAALKQ